MGSFDFKKVYGKHLLSGAPHIHILSQLMILLVVWSVSGDGSALTSKSSSNLLNDIPMHLCG